jgi:hypothetical protein
VVNLRVRLLVGEVHAKPPSHAGDGAAKATWPRYNVDIMLCWRRHDRVTLVMVLPRRFGRDAMSMPSRTGNGATETTLAIA